MTQTFESYLQEVAGSPEAEFDAAMSAEAAPVEEQIDPNYAANNELLIDAMNEVLGSSEDDKQLPNIYDDRILALIDAVTLG